MSGLIDIPTSC